MSTSVLIATVHNIIFAPFGIALFLMAIFLMLLVLVQRGRGGGLAGALGGPGGQSAFGAKAGDVFTKITIVAATVWILLCILSVRILNPPVTEGPKEEMKITNPDQPATPLDPPGGVGEPGDKQPSDFEPPETTNTGTEKPAEKPANGEQPAASPKPAAGEGDRAPAGIAPAGAEPAAADPAGAKPPGGESATNGT